MEETCDYRWGSHIVYGGTGGRLGCRTTDKQQKLLIVRTPIRFEDIGLQIIGTGTRMVATAQLVELQAPLILRQIQVQMPLSQLAPTDSIPTSIPSQQIAPRMQRHGDATLSLPTQ